MGKNQGISESGCHSGSLSGWHHDSVYHRACYCSLVTPEQIHMGKVAALGCALCAHKGFPNVPACVHHLLTGRTPGVRCSDWLTIPLCPNCHMDSKWSIHKLGQFKFDIHHGISEMGLLAWTLRRIYGGSR